MIDLHIHSTFSDGTDKPVEILEKASGLGLHQIAITDHNTIGGSLDALRYLDNYDFDFIIGIEISCAYKGGEVHLLGYFAKDTKDFIALDQLLETSEKYKKIAHLEMIKRLNEHGLMITYDDVKQLFSNTIINRVHLSRTLVQKGYVKSVDEAFDQYLGNDQPCYVARKCVSLQEAVTAIHQCHGLAVIAHPWQYVNHDLENYLLEAINSGIDGIEALHSGHSAAQRNVLIDICHKYHKKITGGSDFHGMVKPDVTLGISQVDDIYKLELNK